MLFLILLRQIDWKPCTAGASTIVRKICKAVAGGCSREASAALSGISTSTLYEWQPQFPQFSEKFTKSRRAI
jgi:hypothetical protein